MGQNIIISAGKRLVIPTSLYVGQRSWTPESISTVAWYDASDVDTITESGGAVSQWDDKSGNANNLAQATGTDQPLFSGSGQSAKVTFDGVTDYLRTTGFVTQAQPLMAFVVGAYNVASTDNQYLIDADPSRLIIGEPSGDGWGIYNTTWLRSTGLNPFSESIYGGVYNGASSAVYVNGSSVLSGDAGSAGVTASDDFYVGRSRTAGLYPLNGYIKEIVLVAGATETDRQRIEGYLAWRWGLVSSLPVSHPYKNYPPIV